jgi:hypothetical protein
MLPSGGPPPQSGHSAEAHLLPSLLHAHNLIATWSSLFSKLSPWNGLQSTKSTNCPLMDTFCLPAHSTVLPLWRSGGTPVCVGSVMITFIFFWCVGGVEFRASNLQNRHSITWATPPVYFVLVILEMRSPELFAQAGLEPWSAQSQPPK